MTLQSGEPGAKREVENPLDDPARSDRALVDDPYAPPPPAAAGDPPPTPAEPWAGCLGSIARANERVPARLASGLALLLLALMVYLELRPFNIRGPFIFCEGPQPRNGFN